MPVGNRTDRLSEQRRWLKALVRSRGIDPRSLTFGEAMDMIQVVQDGSLLSYSEWLGEKTEETPVSKKFPSHQPWQGFL